MLEKENTILKNLDKRAETLEGRVEAIDKKMDGLVVKFEDKFDHLKKGVDGRMFLIITKLELVEKKIDETKILSRNINFVYNGIEINIVCCIFV